MADFRPENKEYIAIGDIHGCLDQLQELVEEKLAPTKNQTLVFLGDYIDRGPNSKGVVEYLIQLRDRYNCVFLMGNHEIMMLEYLSFGSSNAWSLNGGDATLASYSPNGILEIPDSHIDFISSCPYYYDTPNFFFVHAGLKPYFTIEDNLSKFSPHDLTWERDHLAKEHIETQDYVWEKTVVCGHTPQSSPLILNKLICIDTGCVYSKSSNLGKLTAIRLPSYEIVQVKNQQVKRTIKNWLSSWI
ncbi:MAG: serine/threonine protein phosphatase [Chlorobiales bacterium]|jgi:serine/threonine protein phosphatase 1|nr:serine/threonine protein phosphatase [Chlorobiales bacterium]